MAVPPAPWAMPPTPPGRPGPPPPLGPPAPLGSPASSGPPGPRNPLPGPGPRTSLPLPPGGAAARSRTRWWTIGAVNASFWSSMAAVALASQQYDEEPWYTALAFVSLLAAIGVAVSLVWRRRRPVEVCLATSAVALVLPFDALAPLVALSWVVASADRRRILWCTGAAGAAVTASFWRDASREGAAQVFSMTPSDGGGRVVMLPIGYVILGLVLLATALGVGAIRRYQADARTAREDAGLKARQAVQLRSQADDLRTRLTRQEERELIAREMHDTVAHQLSLLSLHASALEVAADDPEVADAARSMRGSAHRALDEMRALIAALRTHGDAFAEQHAGPVPRLADLPVLIAEAKDAGVDIGATVFVDAADAAPATLTRAVYRVVQESLTNAMKHAPGARVDVDLRAAPGRGVDVVVTNPVIGPGAPEGAGAGLVGMRERAESLGGTFRAGSDGRRFEVRVHLPWAVGDPSPLAGPTEPPPVAGPAWSPPGPAMPGTPGPAAPSGGGVGTWR